jgi:putative SOS response-associated peptidase YedK
MCGRYEAGQKQKIAEAFHVSIELDDLYFAKGKECSPGSIQPVIYMRDGVREIGEMRWGFKFTDRLAFNARADKLTASPFWKERLDRRCIVPASSMFEWEKNAAAPKPKYRRTVKRRPVFDMAGLWSPWKNPKTGQWEATFAIITDDPNTKMSAIHDRQAIILEPNEYAEWLAESERPPLHLLRILPAEDLEIEPLRKPQKGLPAPPQQELFDGL